MYAIKQARQLKEKYPEIEVRVFYTDIRAFGKGFEEFYKKAAGDYGVLFNRGRVPEIFENLITKNLLFRVEDTVLGSLLEMEADLVVLSIGMTPSVDTNEIRRILKIPVGPDGFLSEAHPKLRPVDTVVDGVFIGGTASGPKDVPDTVAQAKAAASGAASLMAPGVYIVEPYFASVDDTLCGGCAICISLCPYVAIKIEEKRAKVNRALCKGCGVCAVACPAAAIKMNHFTDDQILAQVACAVQDV